MHDNQKSLHPDAFYHVFNRAIGNEKLFLSAENYRYFLEKYQNYISPIAETFAYCLMPSHFHFLIRMKSLEEIDVASEDLTGFKNLSGLNSENASDKFSKQFSNLFNAYSKAINKQYNRNGSLFTRPFKRKQIESEEHLKNTVIYIHQNPVECGLAKSLNDWPFSSYKDLTGFGNLSGLLAKTEVISWFDDVENFIFCNENNVRA